MRKPNHMLAGCAVLLTIVLTSCSIKVIPLKGQYPDKPHMDTTNLSKDAVWDKVIDFFAQKGLPIKLVDRSSGLIISEKTALIASYEDMKGFPIKKDAWVVIPKMIDPNSRKPFPLHPIAGEWNIRVKELPDKRTLINVNLVNLSQTENILVSSGLKKGTVSQEKAMTRQLDYMSTGNFEKMIAEYIQ